MPALPTLSTFGSLTTASTVSLDTNFTNIANLLANLNNYGNYFVDSGTANNYVVTLTAGQTASFAAGLPVQFKVSNANSGASTLNLSGSGAKSILNPDGSQLTSGQLPLGAIATVMSDGLSYYLMGGAITVGVPMRSYLAGCQLSTAGASITMNISAGTAVDKTNSVAMNLAAIAKTTGAWAVGTAQGGLDFGTIANSLWYFWYVMRRPDTGVVDAICSLSDDTTATITMTVATPAVVTWTAHGKQVGAPVVFTTTGALPTGVTAGTTYYVIAAGLAANAFEFSATQGGSAINTTGTQSGVHTGTSTPLLPTNYTQYRRNAVWKTNSSAQWAKILQYGDRFVWDIENGGSGSLDMNLGNVGTTAQTVSPSVPPGIQVEVEMAIYCSNAGGNYLFLMTSFDQTDSTPSTILFTLNVTGSGTNYNGFWKGMTSTSGTIRARKSASGAGDASAGSTVAWTDTRGRNL